MSSAFAIWILGIPSSGKTTIAGILHSRFEQVGVRTIILETDELRSRLFPNPSFSKEETEVVYAVMTLLAEYLLKSGASVIIAATGFKRRFVSDARARLENFMEVYARCSLETAIKRDSKRLYSRAMKGEIAGLPGLQEKFEEPVNPELVVETDQLDPISCSDIIFKKAANLFGLGSS